MESVDARPGLEKIRKQYNSVIKLNQRLKTDLKINTAKCISENT